ncbi:beta strand repeat-containing protein [Prosthecobacter sp.]|uniref:beta strand repeat-containing protein n=1 Tax=Prosthecobacter sp. TaxID=1965333 RepID=UPI0037833B84
MLLALASQVQAQFAPSTMPVPAVATYNGTVYDSMPQQQITTNRSMLFDSATTFTDGSFTTGTYTYTKTGANTATLSYRANTVATGFTETENSTAQLTFTSAYAGTYTMSGSYSGTSSGTPFSGTLTNGSGTFTVRTQATVTTPTSTAVLTTTATLGGTVVTDGGTTLTARGVVCCPQSVSSTPYTGGPGMTSFTTAGQTGTYTVSATGLLPGTAYVYCAYATNNMGTVYSTTATFTTAPTAPTISTPTSTSVTNSSAVLGGNVTSDCGSPILERGVVFAPSATNSDPVIGGAGVVKVTTSGTTGVFTLTAPLMPGTLHSFKAYATNALGTTYTTPAVSVTTLAGPPVLDTPTVAGLAATQATLGATLVNTGVSGGTIERGVVLAPTATNSNPAVGGTGVTRLTSTGGVGAFSILFSGLLPNTSYSFRAYGTHAYGTGYTSPVSTFTTAVALPGIGTPTSTQIAGSTATLGATVTGDGGGAITARGVLCAPTGVNASPDFGGTGVLDFPASGPHGTGAFTVSATGLTRLTAYSFRAYVTNSAGTVFTAPVSTFTTGPDLPVMDSYKQALYVSSTTVNLYGAVTNNGGGTITECGVVWSPVAVNANPTIGGAGVSRTILSATQSGSLATGLTGLTPDTAYAFCFYATNSSGTAYTPAPGTFTTLLLPVVTTPTGQDITATGATLGANVTDDGNAPDASRYILYSVAAVNSNPLMGGTGVTTVAAGSGEGVFTVPVTGLSAGTTYAFRAQVSNGAGDGRTSVATFTTLTSAPVITTPTSTGITSSSATLGANVTDTGGLATTRGVVYAPTAVSSSPALGDPGVVDAPASSGGSGVFTVNVSGLAPGTAYSFRAYASNTQGTTYTSPASSFTTPALPTLDLPTAASLNFTTATLGGTVTANGGATLTERGVVFSTTAENSDPTIGGTGVTKVVRSGTSTGIFTQGVTGLQPGIQYSYKAYATNSVGTAYTSPAATFTTLGLPLLSNPTVTGVAQTTATLGGSATYYSPYSLTERGVVYAVTTTNSNPMIGGVGVTRVVRSGTGTGAFTQAVSGLVPGTGYSFKAYAINSLGVAYTEPVTTFTTLPGPPALDTPTATVFTDTYARLGAHMASDSGAAITERGVVFAKTSVNANPVIGGTGVTKRLADSDPGILDFFSADVQDLTPNTAYSFKAYAINSVGTTYTSPVTTFSTPTAAPRVDTPTSASITSTTAILGGTVISDGGLTMTRGVVYAPTSVNNNPRLFGTGVQTATVSGTTGTFTVNITGLLPNTAYSFAAYADNSLGTGYTSPVSTFTTPTGPPVLAQPTVYAVAGSGASLGGTLVHTGGASITQRGVVISATSANADPIIGGTGVTTLISGSSGGAGSTIQSTATGLQPATAYTFKVYATNSLGTSYSAAAAVTTLTALDSWRMAYFGTTSSTGNAADEADPDKDGVANLAEYAFGLDPMHSASRLLPSPVHNGSTFKLTFTEPGGVSGVTYSAQWSETLQPGGWTSIPDTGSGSTHIFSVPVTPGSGHEAKVFIRLSLSR